ncbi:stage II sporulation protein R [Cohnella silvisoli]|uniref:Stage II sporulation protein R n=1 Tax=Cohnella silvisoli TaxID=2873699 RepID=A0ABV1KPV7_9BACL|nr:stage II sporulation protein R [Cohnella silvisoli]MCD9022232.1 stage II sporulation protein R [Cohnella silvisoli]
MRHSHHSQSFFFLIASKMTLAGFAIFLGLSALIGQFASASSGKLIPDDAIRIRIIANSDNDSDQQLKVKLRDDVAALVESWGAMPASHDEARQLIKAHLPQIQQLVNAKLIEYDASYGGNVELAKVPFPEKIFDGTSYAAGNYEALRITLGQGAGKNWWCVLFPPLCLTAATAKDDDASASKVKQISTKKDLAKAKADKNQPANEKPHAKFFLWELIKKIIAFLGSLFS